MKKIIKKFFHKGVDNQKRSDISFDVRCPDTADMKKWSLSEKIIGLAFLEDIEVSFIDWKNRVKDALQN